MTETKRLTKTRAVFISNSSMFVGLYRITNGSLNSLDGEQRNGTLRRF